MSGSDIKVWFPIRSGPFRPAQTLRAVDGVSLTVNDVRSAPTGGRFDVLYIDHLGMAVHLPELRALCPWARVVLEEHNVESDFFRQFAAPTC